jgi:hypothetical protein
MNCKDSNGHQSLDVVKEVKELKLLLKEAQARLAPGEEITPETWEMLMRMRKNKHKQPGNELATTLSDY